MTGAVKSRQSEINGTQRLAAKMTWRYFYHRIVRNWLKLVNKVEMSEYDETAMHF